MKLFPIVLLMSCGAFARIAVDALFPLPEPPLISNTLPKPQLGLLTPSKEQLHEMIQAAAIKHNVPPALVKSIVAAESNFDCDAVSPKGAIGLMQLMPETAEEYGVDPTDPQENIDGGTRYLRVLMTKYRKYRDSLKRVTAAYNAGPGVVDRYKGIPPYKETRQYVARVMSYFRQFQKQ